MAVNEGFAVGLSTCYAQVKVIFSGYKLEYLATCTSPVKIPPFLIFFFFLHHELLQRQTLNFKDILSTACLILLINL